MQKQTSSSFSSTWSWLCNLEGASQPSYLSVLSHYPGEPDAEPDSRTVFPGGDVPLRDRRNWRFTRNKQYIIKIKLSCMFFRTYWSFGNITLLLNKKYKCSLLVRCRADVFFSSQLRLLQYQGVGVDQHLSAVSGQVHTKLCTLCTVQCTLCTV